MNSRTLVKFRLYVAGDTPNSAQAMANLGAFCRENLPDRHQIEIVDVFREPQRALADRIFITPTLVKLVPSPMLKIIGTLVQARPMLQALGMEIVATRTWKHQHLWLMRATKFPR
jgi:circadian clock protein KaiB